MYLSLARDPGLSSLISRLTLDELWLRLVFCGAGGGVALIVWWKHRPLPGQIKK